jgi:hypothetical protein
LPAFHALTLQTARKWRRPGGAIRAERADTLRLTVSAGSCLSVPEIERPDCPCGAERAACLTR